LSDIPFQVKPLPFTNMHCYFSCRWQRACSFFLSLHVCL